MRGQTVGAKRFELGRALAGTDELDGQAGDVANRKRRAASGIAIHFGEDPPVTPSLWNSPADLHGVLSGHGIGDEQDFLRRRAPPSMLADSSMSSSSMCSRPAVSMSTMS